MAVGEDFTPELDHRNGGPLHHVTLVEIDEGDLPALARLADALYRWRYGLVVLSPIIVAAAIIGYVAQQPATEEVTVEADRPGSALEPLVAGIAGQSARSGAARPDEPLPSSTIVISPLDPNHGPSGPPDGDVGPSSGPDIVDALSFDDGCTIEISDGPPGATLHAIPTAAGTKLASVPAGTYPVADITDTTDGPGADWYFIGADGMFGWIAGQDTASPLRCP